MVAPFAGGCRCGAVRYEVSSEPVAFMLCHCRDCQYFAGGELAAIAVVLRADPTPKACQCGERRDRHLSRCNTQQSTRDR